MRQRLRQRQRDRDGENSSASPCKSLRSGLDFFSVKKSDPECICMNVCMYVCIPECAPVVLLCALSSIQSSSRADSSVFVMNCALLCIANCHAGLLPGDSPACQYLLVRSRQSGVCGQERERRWLPQCSPCPSLMAAAASFPCLHQSATQSK